MADLVAKMTQQCPVGFPHGDPPLFAFSVFCLPQCDSDLAFVVSR
jgi:hypothetical protein